MYTRFKLKPAPLTLALAFGSAAMLFSPAAQAARGTIYQETVGDNVEVVATADAHPNLVGHAFGVYIQQDQHTFIGNNLTITVSGQAGDGLRSNPSGMTNWQQAKGSITIGDGLKITANGVSADGINANGSTKINIGNGATIATTYDGELKYANGQTSDGAHAVRANFHAEIKIGDSLNASTKGQASHAVFAAQGLGFPGATEGAKITIGDYLTARTAGVGSYGLYAASNKGFIKAGDYTDVLTTGNNAHAAYIGSSNAWIELGSNAKLVTEGTGAHAAYLTASNGRLTLGSSALLQTKLDNSHALYTTGATSTAAIGNDAELVTAGNGSNALYVTARNGIVTLGDRVQLTTDGDNAHGVYVYNYRNASNVSYGDSNITLGADSIISTGGNIAHGVYMQGNNGVVTLNSGTTVGTTGDGSHALYGHGSQSGSNVYGDNGKIIAANGINLHTAGIGSHGAYVDWATSSIDFQGDTTISAPGTNSYAVYANAGEITSSTPGKFTVTGDMRADTTGKVDLQMTDGSRFVGNTSVSAPGGVLNLTISGANSIWQMSQSSDLSSLTLSNNPVIKLGDQTMTLNNPTTPGVTLTIGDLSGSGTFHLRTRIDGPGNGLQNYADLINVTGTSAGSHFITVRDSNTGGATVDGSERLRIVQTADGGATFALTSSVDIGPYIYTLARGDSAFGESGNDWYLSDPPRITPPPGPGNPDPTPNPGPPNPGPKPNPPKTNSADNSANMLNINYLLNYVENQTLMQRMGELRRAETVAQGWVRGYGGKLDSFDGQGLSGFSMDYAGMQFGVDRHFNRDSGQFYLGAMAGFTSASPNYKVGDGDNTSYHVGIYGTYQTVSGFYVDAIAKYMQVDNSYDTYTSGGHPVKGDGDTRGYALGVEIGKRFYLSGRPDAGWYLEPQAQLTYSHQNSATIGSSNGLSTRLDSYDSTIGRAGVIVGYSLAGGSNPIDVYFKSEVLSEFSGDTGYVFNNTVREKYDFKSTWWNNGIGVNAQLAKRHNLYADMNYASGGKFDQMQVNIGYRYMF